MADARLSYRFALEPRWILSHVFVLACVVAFVNLGLWQLRRLDERQTLNATVATRIDQAPVPLSEVISPDADASTIDAARYRDVSVTGTYRAGEQVRIANRTNEGAAGWWVATPLDLGDGTTVIVNRGWIPLPMGDGAPEAYAPPGGTVTVTGLVRRSGGGPAPAPGASASAADPVTQLGQVDLAVLGRQVSGTLYPVYLDLQAQEPAQPAGVPVPVPRPTLDDGPHFSYAMQWFTFATLTVIVYPLLLRRVARQRASESTAATTGATS